MVVKEKDSEEKSKEISGSQHSNSNKVGNDQANETKNAAIPEFQSIVIDEEVEREKRRKLLLFLLFHA